MHPSGRICSKMNTHLNPDKKGSNITTTSGRKKELKVATTRIDNVVYSSKLYSPSAPIVRHRSRRICSKQTELKVAMTTIEPVPDKQVGNLSAPIIRHHSGCICSKQNGLKVATTTTTNVTPDQQAEDMTTPAVRHCSGHICSKQGELKTVTNTIKTETSSKLIGKTTNTSTLPDGSTSQ